MGLGRRGPLLGMAVRWARRKMGIDPFDQFCLTMSAFLVIVFSGLALAFLVRG